MNTQAALREPLLCSCHVIIRTDRYDRSLSMPEDNHVRIIVTRPSFSKEQKAAFGLLVAFGAFGLIFGVFYLWKHIAAPFAISYSGPRLQTSEEQQSEEVLKAKRTDTDGDSVSDYDELYVFKTSPYLLDTDSDGINDQVEIASGSDPSCALGAACETDVDTVADTSLDGSFLDETADEYRYTADGSVTIPDSYSVEDIIASLPADEIRAMLIEQGADAAEIEKISDDELRVILIDALRQMEANGDVNLDGATSTGSGTDASTDVQATQ